MSRWTHAAARLYPRRWRERYGREFDRLLKESGGSAHDFWDVLRGALTMQVMTWNWKLTLSLALAGGVIAASVAWSMPPRFISRAAATVNGTDANSLPGILLTAETEMLSRTSLEHIIRGYGLYRDEQSRVPMEEIVNQMRQRDIRIVSHPGNLYHPAPAVIVTFTGASANQARTVNQVLLAKLQAALMISSLGATHPMTVLDPPSSPEWQSNPNRTQSVAAGVLAGLLLAAVVAGVRRMKPPTRTAGPPV